MGGIGSAMNHRVASEDAIPDILPAFRGKIIDALGIRELSIKISSIAEIPLFLRSVVILCSSASNHLHRAFF